MYPFNLITFELIALILLTILYAVFREDLIKFERKIAKFIKRLFGRKVVNHE